MDDLRKRSDLKTRVAVILALLEDSNVTHLPPYIILHEKGVGMQILIDEEDRGLRKLLEHKLREKTGR